MKRYSFKAKIQSGDGGGAYVFFPYDVEKEFGARGKIPVEATFDGVAYNGSLIKYGYPEHMLGVLKSIRVTIGKQPGDMVDVVLWKDEAVRTLDIPAAFVESMKAHGVYDFFEQLSYTHRKEYVRWISEAKKEETRLRRAEKAIAMLQAKVKTPG